MAICQHLSKTRQPLSTLEIIIISLSSFFSPPTACRLFSRGVIFTRARVLLAILFLRKNWDYSYSTLKAEVTNVIYRNKNQRTNVKREGLVYLPEKTADILRRHHLFPRELMSEKRAHKIHTDYTLLPILITACVSGGGGGGCWVVRGETHIKIIGMLFSKLMGLNCSFGSQDRKLTFLCIQISRWVVYKKILSHSVILSNCFKDSI